MDILVGFSRRALDVECTTVVIAGEARIMGFARHREP